MASPFPLSRSFRRPRRNLRLLRLAYGPWPSPPLPLWFPPSSPGHSPSPFRYRKGGWRRNFTRRLPSLPFAPDPLLRRRTHFRRLMDRWHGSLVGGAHPYEPFWEWLHHPLLRRASKRVGGYRLTYGYFRPFSTIGPLLPPLPSPPAPLFSLLLPQWGCGSGQGLGRGGRHRLLRLLLFRFPLPFPLFRRFLLAQRMALLPASPRRALVPLRHRPRPPRPPSHASAG